MKIVDDTMLWFCSDNGPEGDASAPGRTKGLRGRKRSLYEGGIRVPAIVRYPAMIEAASTSDELIERFGRWFERTFI